MFWKFNNASSSPIETVLAKENLTLQELLNEEDIINECKSQNKTLIDFLMKPEVIDELVTLATVEPSPDIDEAIRFKYSNLACEILTCDVPALNERLAGDEMLLSKLYSFLDCEPPLNPLLASFFSKIMGILIAKKTEQNWLSYQFTCLQVIEFLKAKNNFIPILLKHMGTSAVMDLTLKLMTQVEGDDVRPNILNWLDDQQLIQALVSLLDPAVEKEAHYNVAQLLCDFIIVARDNQKNSTDRNECDPLLDTIEMPDTVSLLLDHMLKGRGTESCIVGGIQVILTLLDVTRNCNTEEDANSIAERRKVVVKRTVNTVLQNFRRFHVFLLSPPYQGQINTTIGVLNPPLGNTRLHITKLVAAIISSKNTEPVKELISLGTMQVLLDLFYKYPWNNFLHTQVEACITSALKAQIPSETADDDALYKHLLVKCKLIERMLDAWNENDAQQTKNKGVRQGYMGHLTNIANVIAELCSSTSLGQFLKDTLPEVNESFIKFKETTLDEVNKIRGTLLGGANPNTSNEDSDEYGETVPFPITNYLHSEVFTQYQIQQITPQYIENYGFNNDFNYGDNTLQMVDHRTGMNFNLSEGDLVHQHDLFKQVCAQNINTLDDSDDQIFEERDNTFQTVIDKGDGQEEGASSSGSDDDSPPAKDPFLDAYLWSNKGSESAIAPISSENPWDAPEKEASEANSDWAAFSSPSFANFEANFESQSESATNDQSTEDVKTGEDVKNVAHDVNSAVLQEETKEREEKEEKTPSITVDPTQQKDVDVCTKTQTGSDAIETEHGI